MENQNSEENPTIKLLTQIMIYIDGASWILFGITAGMGLIPGLPEGLIRWAMSGLAITAGGTLLLLYAISNKYKWAFYLLLGLLALISLLSITDQVGLFDWIAFAVNLAALVLLVLAYRKPG